MPLLHHDVGVQRLALPGRPEIAVAELVEPVTLHAEASSGRVFIVRTDDTVAPVRPAMVRRALRNLIDNAIKYTPEGGEVRIGAKAHNDEVIIEVANTGPGIPAKHLPRIFERFYRVDAGRSRELGGTGLGLSIVKHIVAKIGGGITVDSAGGWTRFRLQVPRADSPKSDTHVSPG